MDLLTRVALKNLKNVDRIKAAHLATTRYHKMEARTVSTAEGRRGEKNTGPPLNASTKRKRRVPLNIFKETGKTSKVNTITRRQSEAKDNGRRSRSPAMTDSWIEEPLSTQVSQDILSTQSASQTNSRPLRESIGKIFFPDRVARSGSDPPIP